jgi:alanyl-tRNA synthetase
MTSGNNIRQGFLKYFEKNGHRIVRSSPLLPANDPTLLFANAGMNQFKDLFLGHETRDYTRATSSQKCLRAGGKHNDLDEVGKTARHHTFFEMLGNFSFGDYFKEDAIAFAWDLLLKVYSMPVERLWFTVYKDDDEAMELWKKIGAPADRVLRFGEKDNFWQMGDTGPCGPCSEIHYYTGEDPNDPQKNRAEFVNGPGDTTVEIWNLVFMQFDRDASGKLTPLPKPSVDTGAGLERVTAVMQNVKTNYDTDLIRPILDFISKLSAKAYSYNSNEGFVMRVIADHARAAAFSIADGILPGNEGRNYVIRKIMRRAIYHGQNTLGFEDLFFNKVTDFVIESMREAYPELDASREYISKMVKIEEERFRSTLSVGLQKLEPILARSGSNPDFKELAKLYDTFGTPRDLLRVGLEERGIVLNEEEFNVRFDTALRELQQSSSAKESAARPKVKSVYTNLPDGCSQCLFTGYDGTRLEGAKVRTLIRGEEQVKELREGEEGEVVLDQTPFYAESGGQVGDTGAIVSGQSHVTVLDTYSPVTGLIVHKVRVDKGTLRSSDEVTAQVDMEKRDSTRRNHTATHLLHAALREVLGNHVKQAGSLVAPGRLRFDFSHFQPLTREEIREIERLVNEQILRNSPVQTDVLPLEQAMQSGAMALFGEKYAEKVRVLTVPGFSVELCGGTHVRATGDIGVFKIVKDEAIASGTRRLEAVTGVDALTRFQEDEALLDTMTNGIRVSRADLPTSIERLQEELRRARREADELKLRIATGSGSSNEEAREIDGIKVVAREVPDLDSSAMRQLSDTLLARIRTGVVILGRRSDGKASVTVRVSSDVTERISAGEIIKELSTMLGGRGGGKRDMAEGGGNLPDKLPEALEKSFDLIRRLLGSGK